jgi:plasmid maintenance system antidote protein VapI
VKPACRHPRGCTTAADTDGWCNTHYRVRLVTGENGYVDAAPVAEHLRKLSRLGWAPTAAAQAAGVSHRTATQLLAGRWSRVRSATARAILALPLTLVESKLSVDATGTRRRVEALGRMGWTARSVSEAVGLQPGSLSQILWRGTVSFATAHRIAEFYQRNSGTFGGNGTWARRAARLGYAPPAAWDDDTIDDPRAKPQGVRRAA